jgi:hypothetical protein
MGFLPFPYLDGIDADLPIKVLKGSQVSRVVLLKNPITGIAARRARRERPGSGALRSRSQTP